MYMSRKLAPSRCALRSLASTRIAVFAASISLSVGAPGPALAKTPYYPFKHFITNTSVGGTLASAIVDRSSAGLVFTLPWSSIKPDCGSFNFLTDAKDVLGYLAANLRADQMIWPGIGGGAESPACLAGLGIPTVSILYAFGNKSHDPCVNYAMPLMSGPAYGTLYVASVHAMLVALAGISVASGGTLADRVAGINLGAYAAVSTELQIPARGCRSGAVHQSAAAQTHLWVVAGYKGSQAIRTYAAILQAIFTDPALPAGASVLQDTVGDDVWSFPQPHNAQAVLWPMLSAATQTWGNRFVISWNQVSGTGPLPPQSIITAAESGTQVALEFNSTARKFTTSCRGILPNGKLDSKTASPACFHHMQPRNSDLFPNPLVLWQVEPADFAVRHFFP